MVIVGLSSAIVPTEFAKDDEGNRAARKCPAVRQRPVHGR